MEETNERKKMMSIRFQVADVLKPLIAVKRLTEKGNTVSFGPGAEDNFIMKNDGRQNESAATWKGIIFDESEFFQWSESRHRR